MSAPGLFRGGFLPPRPGTRMCEAMVKYDGTRVIAPRPCARAAQEGQRFCGLHQLKAERIERLSAVRVELAGFCVVCGEAAHTYELDGTRIGLCGKHGKSLAWAITVGGR